MSTRMSMSMLTVVGLAAGEPAFSKTEVPPAPSFRFEEIVVTATRLLQKRKDVGVTVDTITRRQLAALQPKDLGEALEGTTGILMHRYGAPGAIANLSVRGATAAQVLVLLDGRPVNSRASGDFDVNALPMDNIDRIEVVRGAASSLYGANAMGGVINVITRQATERSRGQLAVESGVMPDGEQNRTASFQVYRASQQWRAGGWDLNWGGSVHRSDGHRVNSGYFAYDWEGNTGWDLGGGSEVRLFGGLYAGDKHVPGSTTFRTPTALQRDDRAYLRAQWKQGLGGDARLTGSLYGNREGLRFENDPLDAFKSDQVMWNAGSEWQLDLPWGGGHLSNAGVHVFGEALTGLQSGVDPGAPRLATVAAFAQHQAKVSDLLQGTAGLRGDWNSQFGAFVSPHAAVLAALSPEVKLRASAGLAFRAPNLNELYYPNFGNTRLNPERAVSVDLGLETEWAGGWNARLTGFYSRVTDLIAYAVEPGTGNYLPFNVNRAYWTGVEADLRGVLGAGWSWFGSYTFLIAKDEATGLWLPRRPQHQGTVGINFESPWGSSATLRVQAQDVRFDDATNVTAFPRVITGAFSLSQELGAGVRVVGKIENIGDETYEIIGGYPMPRRTVSAGLQWDL